MKSVLSDKCCKKEEKPFPKLMISTNDRKLIVLFTSESEGTVVHKGNSVWLLGSHNNNWCHFKDYEGDVCLTND